MSLTIAPILNAVVSHALASGVFDRVNAHEPKVPPGAGITCAVWVDRIEPARSGLNSTSVRMTLNVRLFTSMLSEPQDSIDPNLTNALDVLMTAYSGDFELGGNVRNIDLLTGLVCQAGYVNQNDRMFRVYTIVLPLIVNDVWSQVP